MATDGVRGASERKDMNKQAVIQQYVDVWRTKGVADQQADFEYVIASREMLFDFIRSKDLFDEWIDYFGEARRES
jgi:hypothetical protein